MDEIEDMVCAFFLRGGIGMALAGVFILVLKFWKRRRLERQREAEALRRERRPR